MILRPCTDLDKPACIAIARGNTPLFILENELPELEAILNNPPCPYFVVENAAREVIACGGYRLLPEKNAARLCWGMVRRDLHRAGVGRFLLRARLDEIRKTNVETVALDTSQHSMGFFEKEGFTTIQKIQNGYGAGLDRVEMELKIQKI